MKFSTQTRNNIVGIICYIYVLLFIYAATSKFLDFENFRIQLGQSPLLSAFAVWISVAVPVSEIIIAILLLIPKFRFLGLFAAYSLMVMFTAYIYIILNYSSFIPCSCGGVLEKMGWTEHIVFNLIFIVIAAIGVFYLEMNRATLKTDVI